MTRERKARSARSTMTRRAAPGRRACLVGSACVAAFVCAAQLSLVAGPPAGRQQSTPPTAGCRVSGKVLAGTEPLPGAAVVVSSGDTVKAVTSSGADGTFTILFGPNATYHVTVELTAFARAERDLTLGAVPCDTSFNVQLTLRPRSEPIPQAATEGAGSSTPTAQAGPAPTAEQPSPTTVARSGNGPQSSGPGRAAGAGGRGNGGRGGAAAGNAADRFQTLDVQEAVSGNAAADAAAPDPAEVSRFLPAGFSLQNAQSEAVAINGNTDAFSVDRGAMNDRMTAIGRGEFDPATGQFAAGFGPQAGAAGDGAAAGEAGAGRGGRGGAGGFGGGRGGPGGFVLGGRGGRGQNLFQGSANYSYGGSALDATNLQPRNGVITPVSQLPFNRNNFGMTLGGPVRIPGVYDDANRRTNFQLNYSGNHSTQLQDSYLTVPTLEQRQCASDASLPCDFSSSPIAIINPATGQPFAGNRIPGGALDPSARSLLAYIPSPNVPGVSTNNFHNAASTLSTSNSFSLRVTQNLSPTTLTQNGRGGAGGAGRRGAGPGGGGRGGRGGRGLSIVLNGQVQYRENDGQQFNAIPGFTGATKSTTVGVPVSLNISRNRTTQNISVQVNTAHATSANPFTNHLDVASAAGIGYPPGDTTSTDPLNFGVPNLTFSNFNVRLPAATLRDERRITTSYSLTHPFGKHQLRVGADFHHDRSLAESNGNARGSFTFTGLYTSNGAQISRDSGADFADFLLGLPQQATLQAGGTTHLSETAFDVYLDDNWQRSARLTLSLGLRYELTRPYVEADGHMANLDVSPGFTGAQVVCPITVTGVCNATGSLSGTSFPSALLNTDANNVGPRLGAAYRVAPGTVLRGGYSITYNTGSYASIARALVGQPPWAYTGTNTGTLVDPLTIANGVSGAQEATTNNYGVDPFYALGMIQTWNGTLTRELGRTWQLTAGYTGTKGTDLDLLRAPNRNPDGTLRIDDVQPFIWESSGGHSILQLGNFQLTRRYAKGLSGNVNYTIARSMDNASSLGAGGAVVAQNDHDLDAEWALSNFDRRHQLSANLFYELPFGVGRRWLKNGGLLSAIVGEWSASMHFSAQSGSPLTARVVGATSSVASGTSGSLRADLTGQPIAIPDPSLGQFFDTSAFSVPPLGQFGDSPRNVIIGPGGHVTNASFNRDMRIGGTRAVTIQVNANNLFNTIQWQAIDTNINSSTFGQVTRFAPMRTLTLNLRFRY